MNYNRVILCGNLTRDVELKSTQSKTAIANFTLAVNRSFKKQDGSTDQEAAFADCTAFGRTAETLNQYLSKGSPLMVEGRLKTDQWQDQQGNNRSKLKVIVERFEFVGSRQGADDGARASNGQQTFQGSGKPNRTPAAAASDQITEESIPF